MSTDNSQAGSRRGILRAGGITAAGTLTSRALGFLRDVVIASVLGTGAQAEAFFVAFRLPNMFRDLVGEGAANAAVVPVLTEERRRLTPEFYRRLVGGLLSLAGAVLLILGLAGIAAAPLLVRMIAPGFVGDPERLAQAVRLTRILFPYLPLIGLTAYGAAVLYCERAFGAPAFAPCLLNLSLIAAGLAAAGWRTGLPVYVLASGALLGGVLQVFVVLAALHRRGLRWGRPRPEGRPVAMRIGRLLGPRMVGAGVYQLNVFIDTLCASLASIVGAGGIAAVYYASRLIQFPMGIFTFAIAAAVLPSLSGLATTDMTAFRRTLTFSLRILLLLLAPCGVLLLLLAPEVVRLLFERGAFEAHSTAVTASALAAYAVGLCGFGANRILVTAFHAMQDTRTPVRFAAVALAVNLVLNLLLMGPLRVAGIALASSAAAGVNGFLLSRELGRRLGGWGTGWGGYVPRVLAAAALAGVTARMILAGMPGSPDPVRWIAAGVAAACVYAAACWTAGIPEIKEAGRWIFRPGSRPSP